MQVAPQLVVYLEVLPCLPTSHGSMSLGGGRQHRDPIKALHRTALFSSNGGSSFVRKPCNTLSCNTLCIEQHMWPALGKLPNAGQISHQQ